MPRRRTGQPITPKGKRGSVEIDGVTYKWSSSAEERWLNMIAPGLPKEPTELIWQPGPFPITYKQNGVLCTDTYRPDAYVTWKDGSKQYFEIKNGFLPGKVASKIKRFCQQYPDKPLVMVWFGRLPKNADVAKRLDKLQKHLHHTCYVP